VVITIISFYLEGERGEGHRREIYIERKTKTGEKHGRKDGGKETAMKKQKVVTEEHRDIWERSRG
jgi:hypothetical protein